MDEKIAELNTSDKDEIIDVSDFEDGDSVKSSVLSLHHGKELLSSETYSITATETSKLIAVLGATGSGKTTLITSIYQQFLQKEKTDCYCFSGSMTLDAFEQRAYDTRISSNRSEARMERTPRGKENCILHLRVMNFNDMLKQNLFFADYSGEDCEAVAADVDFAKAEFHLVRSAKCVILLLDGEKIADQKFRLNELQRAAHLLRTLIDANLLRRCAQVLIVISKMDLVNEAETNGKKISIDILQDSLLCQLPELKECAIFFHVAAMPLIGEGYGICELFSYIMKSPSTKPDLRPSPVLASQFNLWGGRN